MNLTQKVALVASTLILSSCTISGIVGLVIYLNSPKHVEAETVPNIIVPLKIYNDPSSYKGLHGDVWYFEDQDRGAKCWVYQDGPSGNGEAGGISCLELK